MYSGTTFRNASGNVMGAHQKIDRVAKRLLDELLPGNDFPNIKNILHFEGKNGPDGVKRKSPAQDEPWHYYDPKDPAHQQLLDIISEHYKSLVKELRSKNNERAAFEAAWLAHALVDGLTPAHHYPYEAELTKLRGGRGIETRDSIKEKLLMSGDSTLQTLANNWRMWGAKGLMTTHALFELGIAALISPLRLKRSMPSQEILDEAKKQGIKKTFKLKAEEIDNIQMYERFYRLGWTKKLARETRQYLVPEIIRVVIVAWYMAYNEANNKNDK